MEATALFGSADELGDFEQLAAERAGAETTENAMTPITTTITISLMVCPTLSIYLNC